ncbi:MAG: hypothetical protein JO281_18515 [Pseudonocardiales bacterium]|nr:hypothetical protein [Pseudonocardiales bacterium]
MGRHDKDTDNGQNERNVAKTKDGQEAGGGRHSTEDKGDENDKDEEDDETK